MLKNNHDIQYLIVEKLMNNPYDVDRNFFILLCQQHISYLKYMPELSLKKLYYKCKRVFYEHDQMLFEYGDACDCIHIILSGFISIELINKKKDVMA